MSAKKTAAPARPRLENRYQEEIVPQMMGRFSYRNLNAVPRLQKITVSMGVGKAVENSKRIDAAVKDLSMVTGQKPLVTKAKKSIAGFKVREGMNVGAKVTLRGRRMYEFFDRLISVVIPRIRDFRGFSPRAFDGHGNYSLGLTEQLVFPEISVDDVEFVQGLNVCVTIDRSSDEESLALLEFFGFPFRR
jgi:large subunit ribosomal protein L5